GRAPTPWPGRHPAGRGSGTRRRSPPAAVPAAQASRSLGMVDRPPRRHFLFRAPHRVPAGRSVSVLSEPGRAAEPILEVTALTKHFGGLRAVHLDLSVDAGGPSRSMRPNRAGTPT